MAAESPNKMLVSDSSLDMETKSGYVLGLDKAVVEHIMEYVD